MGKQRQQWVGDTVGTIGYNAICALEVSMMNLIEGGFIGWYWTIEEAEYLDERYKEGKK